MEIKTDAGITGWGECLGPHTVNAAAARQPVNRYAGGRPSRPPVPWLRARRRLKDSTTTPAATTASSTAPSCAAVLGDSRLFQARYTPVANVSTARWSATPKSASVSITTSATPAAMAGRASGRLTRQNVDHGPWPSTRPASAAAPDRPRNAVRDARYTYGYSDSPSTATAPPSDRTSGNQ